jgi:VWFA-related protein
MRREIHAIPPPVSYFLRFSFFILLSLLAASGQNNPPPQLQPRTSEAPAPSTASRQISIDVQVTDKSGDAIRGLRKQDFTLLDDKQPLNIVSFRAVDNSEAGASAPPIEIILVVDAVNAPFQAVATERGEIRKFLLQNGGRLAQPVSLIVFSDRGTNVQNGSSQDGNTLAELYDQYQNGLRSINRSQGVYGDEERFDMSLNTIHSLAAYERTRPGRKLMIWVSPGWPLLSGPRLDLSAKQQRQLFGTIVASSTELRDADVTLYTVDPFGLSDIGIRTTFYKEFVKGVPYAQRALPGDLGLQVLAVQSGGRVMNSSNDLTSEISACTADARAFYVLSFEPPKPDHPDEYHTLQVSVNKPGAAARTRTGYYDQP